MPFAPAFARNAALPGPVDTRLTLETPEGIELVLRPAGLVVRALAFAIDLALRAVLLAALILILGQMGRVGFGLGALLLFLINWWYMVLFEVLRQGRSPGKQLMGLCVVHDDATPVGWTASLIRNLLRAIDILPVAYCAGAFCSLHHPHFKRLGDIAAGTLVIYRSPRPLPAPIPPVPPLPAPWPLQVAEQQAIIALAERDGHIPAHRARELAALLAHTLPVPADQALITLHGVARHLRDTP